MECPYCRSGNITLVDAEEGAYVVYKCKECGQRWDEEEEPDPEDTQIIQHPLFPEDKRSWDNYS